MHAASPTSDFTEPLLGILTRYVSAPTAQSILKLARQRAGVATPRLDRAQIAAMFAPIERHLRLFVGEMSRVNECCTAIHLLIEGRSAPLGSGWPAEPSSVWTPPPSSVRSSEPSSARSIPPSSGRSSEPVSVRAPAPNSARSSGPVSVRAPAPNSTRSAEPVSVRSGPPASVLASVPSSLVQIRSEDDLARARSEARDLASALGFSVVGRTRLVTAVSELARNIVLYAGEGQIELTPLAAPAGITVVAVDRGPGIANLEQIMVGDYKSRLGMGLGLRGVKRLVDRFEIQTAVGQGTTVTFFLKVL